jgi:hypothetical protein
MLLDVTTERDVARRVQQNAYKMKLLQEQEALLNRRLEAANAELLVSQRELEASRAALLCAHEKLQLELTEAASYVRSLLASGESSNLGRLYQTFAATRGSEPLEDDFSIVRFAL